MSTIAIAKILLSVRERIMVSSVSNVHQRSRFLGTYELLVRPSPSYAIARNDPAARVANAARL